jgi:hypothetical protein
MKLTQLKTIIKEEVQRVLTEGEIGNYQNGLYTDGLIFATNIASKIAQIKGEMGDFIKKTGQVVSSKHNPRMMYLDGVTLDVKALYKAIERGKVESMIPSGGAPGEERYGLENVHRSLDIYMVGGLSISFKDIPDNLYQELSKYAEDVKPKVWRVTVQIAPPTRSYLFNENEFGEINKYQIPTIIYNKVKQLEPEPADRYDEKSWRPIKKYILKVVIPELTKQVRSVFPVVPGITEHEPYMGSGRIFYNITPTSKNPKPPTEQDKTKLINLLKGAIDVEIERVAAL